MAQQVRPPFLPSWIPFNLSSVAAGQTSPEEPLRPRPHPMNSQQFLFDLRTPIFASENYNRFQ